MYWWTHVSLFNVVYEYFSSVGDSVRWLNRKIDKWKDVWSNLSIDFAAPRWKNKLICFTQALAQKSDFLSRPLPLLLYILAKCIQRLEKIWNVSQRVMIDLSSKPQRFFIEPFLKTRHIIKERFHELHQEGGRKQERCHVITRKNNDVWIRRRSLKSMHHEIFSRIRGKSKIKHKQLKHHI